MILVMLGLVHAGLGVGFKVIIHCVLHFMTIYLSFCSITILAPDLFPLQRLLLHRLDEFLHSCLYACAYYDVILSVVLLFAKIRLSCRPKMSWRMEPGGVMCFSPTMEQFRDFSAFVAYMEDQGAHKFGIAKVQD